MAGLTLSDVRPVKVRASCLDCGRTVEYKTFQVLSSDVPSLWDKPRCDPCQKQYLMGNVRVTVNGRVSSRKRTPDDPQ